jgi:catechol-2,3-dioxygenase
MRVCTSHRGTSMPYSASMRAPREGEVPFHSLGTEKPVAFYHPSHSALRIHMTPSLSSVDHIHVFVSDRVAAESWYFKVLGLRRVEELAFWAPNGGPLTIANQTNTVHLALFEAPAQKSRSTVAFGVSASELLAWQAHLVTALEREVELVDHTVSWSLYFKDIDANPYEITTYEHSQLVALRAAGA